MTTSAPTQTVILSERSESKDPLIRRGFFAYAQNDRNLKRIDKSEFDIYSTVSNWDW